MLDAILSYGAQEGTLLQRWLARISLASAALGGVTIFAVTLAVTASVVMRNIGLGGIRGDFEMVELAAASCASLFLPLCQLKRGHVVVDLFTDWLPRVVRARLEALWSLLFAGCWAALCWFLMQGLSDSYAYDDKTMLLNFPVWTVYLPAVFATGLAALIALVTAHALAQDRGLPEEWE